MVLEIMKNENTQTIPNTAYGKSKLEAEKNYINWQNHNEKENILTICRPGVVFGPGENGNVTRLIKAVQKKLFFYMGNKYLKKSGIYIDELINAITWINDNQINNKFEKLFYLTDPLIRVQILRIMYQPFQKSLVIIIPLYHFLNL